MALRTYLALQQMVCPVHPWGARVHHNFRQSLKLLCFHQSLNLAKELSLKFLASLSPT